MLPVRTAEGDEELKWAGSSLGTWWFVWGFNWPRDGSRQDSTGVFLVGERASVLGSLWGAGGGGVGVIGNSLPQICCVICCQPLNLSGPQLPLLLLGWG